MADIKATPAPSLRGILVIMGVVVLFLLLLIYTKNKDFTAFIKSSSLQTQTVVTEEEALEKVQNLPEVQEYVQKSKNRKISSEGENSQKNTYIIHVFEDLPNQQTTFNRYFVDKTSGDISKEF